MGGGHKGGKGGSCQKKGGVRVKTGGGGGVGGEKGERGEERKNSEELKNPNLMLVSKKAKQYTSNLYGSTPPICISGPSWLLRLAKKGKANTTVHLPFVLQYASHLYCSTPPICTEVLLRRYWGLGLPGSSRKMEEN